MRRSIALLLTAAAVVAATQVDPCDRQPFRGRCPNANGPPTRSQFVLRYYMRNNECVSYPFGHCANDDSEPQLFRYKEECEEACLAPGNLGSAEDGSFETYGTLSPAERERLNPTTRAVPTTTTEEETTTVEETTTKTATTTPSTSKATTTTPRTECERRRAAASSSLVKGGFVPKCEDNGAFSRNQCEPDGRQCFCVDAAGIEVANSRTRDGSKPDCDGIVRASAPRTNECVGVPETGPCSSTLLRWHYDEEAQECKRFAYSGCGGNGNNYETEEACRDRCVPVSVECPRGQPLRNTQGYFVNCAKQTCPSGYECHNIGAQAICCAEEKKTEVGDLTSPVEAKDVCSLPKERGPCDKYELRFYYNPETKECKYFFFGGCEGNGNNFARVEDCEQRCGVVKPTTRPSTTVPPPPPTTTTTTRQTTTTTTQRPTSPSTTRRPPPPPTAQLPTTFARPIGQDTQTTLSEETRCSHPVDGGNCQGHFVRWFWNEEKATCEVFTYTGCQGNGNNFASREECLSICHGEGRVRGALAPTVAAAINVCAHDVDAGECNGVFQRFAFDSEAGECRAFTYGGCGGNGNNFATMIECKQRCQQDTLGGDVCTGLIEAGECSGVFQRFAFDRNVGDCRPFNYGGCGGNGNNFASLGECRGVCSQHLTSSCPPRPSCDLSRCQLLLDVRGCPFCSCPPSEGEKVEAPGECPLFDPSRCVEPCVSFTNRLGCMECSCPRQGEAAPPPPTFMPQPTPPHVQPQPHPQPVHIPHQGSVPHPSTTSTSAPSTTTRTTPHAPAPQTRAPAPPAPRREPSPPASPSAPSPRQQAVLTHESQDKPLPPPSSTPKSSPLPSETIEKCLQPVDAGPCDRFVDRFYFDAKDGRCHDFKYGGCAGNRNHFFSMRECEIHCARFSRFLSEQDPMLAIISQRLSKSMDKSLPFIEPPGPSTTLPPTTTAPLRPGEFRPRTFKPIPMDEIMNWAMEHEGDVATARPGQVTRPHTTRRPTTTPRPTTTTTTTTRRTTTTPRPRPTETRKVATTTTATTTTTTKQTTTPPTEWKEVHRQDGRTSQGRPLVSHSLDSTAPKQPVDGSVRVPNPPRVIVPTDQALPKEVFDRFIHDVDSFHHQFEKQPKETVGGEIPPPLPHHSHSTPHRHLPPLVTVESQPTPLLHTQKHMVEGTQLHMITPEQIDQAPPHLQSHMLHMMKVGEHFMHEANREHMNMKAVEAKTTIPETKKTSSRIFAHPTKNNTRPLIPLPIIEEEEKKEKEEAVTVKAAEEETLAVTLKVKVRPLPKTNEMSSTTVSTTERPTTTTMKTTKKITKSTAKSTTMKETTSHSPTTTAAKKLEAKKMETKKEETTAKPTTTITTKATSSKVSTTEAATAAAHKTFEELETMNAATTHESTVSVNTTTTASTTKMTTPAETTTVMSSKTTMPQGTTKRPLNATKLFVSEFANVSATLMPSMQTSTGVPSISLKEFMDALSIDARSPAPTPTPRPQLSTSVPSVVPPSSPISSDDDTPRFLLPPPAHADPASARSSPPDNFLPEMHRLNETLREDSSATLGVHSFSSVAPSTHAVPFPSVSSVELSSSGTQSVHDASKAPSTASSTAAAETTTVAAEEVSTEATPTPVPLKKLPLHRIVGGTKARPLAPKAVETSSEEEELSIEEMDGLLPHETADAVQIAPEQAIQGGLEVNLGSAEDITSDEADDDEDIPDESPAMAKIGDGIVDLFTENENEVTDETAAPTTTVTKKEASTTTAAPSTTTSEIPRPPSTFTPFPVADSTFTPFPEADSTFTPFPQAESTFVPFPKAESTFGPFPKAESTLHPFPKAESTFSPFPEAETTFTPFPEAQSTFTPFPRAESTFSPFPVAESTFVPFPAAESTFSAFPTAATTFTPFPEAHSTFEPFPEPAKMPTHEGPKVEDIGKEAKEAAEEEEYDDEDPLEAESKGSLDEKSSGVPVDPLPVEADGAGRQPIPSSPVGIAASSPAEVDFRAVCGQPAEAGPCFDYSPRWYFNPETSQCEQFSYGGCGGNQNNFAEKKACELRCNTGDSAGLGQVAERCTLEKDVGTGGGFAAKWFFDFKSLQCEQFVFEGEGGNANQFDSLSECERICTMSDMLEGGNIPVSEESDDYEDPVTGSDGGETAPLLEVADKQLPFSSIDDATDFEDKAKANIGAAAHASKTVQKNYNSVPIRTVVDENGEELPIVAPSPPETINYQTGSVKISGIKTFDESNGRIPIDNADDVEESSTIAMPSCPNDMQELRYKDGRPVMCLPGKNQCPEKSVCFFNGVDYFCCPEEEDPYDKHVFGGYNGEEIKHGYKRFGPLNIRRLRDDYPVQRRKRQADFSIDSITAPLRFDDKPITRIYAARPITARRHPGSKRKTPCDYPLEKGECAEQHLRYFYDKSSDSCRMFHYTGCNGNANNFGSERDCQEMCVKGFKTAKAQQEKLAAQLPPGQCPNGEPLGGAAPVLCGNSTESIGCPRGYFCRQGPPDVCCQDIPIDQILAASPDQRDVIVNKQQTKSVPTTTTTRAPVYCPDASDPLLTKSGEIRQCGSGFDGLKMCPRGFYCAINAEANTRLCCPLLGSSSRLPYQHGVIPPYFGRRSPNSGEIIERGSLPSDVVKDETEMEAKALDDFIVPSEERSRGPKSSLERFVDDATVESEEVFEDEDQLARSMLRADSKTLAQAQGELLAEVEEEKEIPRPTPVLDTETVQETKKTNDKSRCLLRPDEGRACTSEEMAPRTNLHYFYSSLDGRCKLYFFKASPGCGGNANRFDKKSECESACMTV